MACSRNRAIQRQKRIERFKGHKSIAFPFFIDWCCFYYFVRNSLVALLEALCARVIIISSCGMLKPDHKASFMWIPESVTERAVAAKVDAKMSIEWQNNQNARQICMSQICRNIHVFVCKYEFTHTQHHMRISTRTQLYMICPTERRCLWVEWRRSTTSGWQF